MWNNHTKNRRIPDMSELFDLHRLFLQSRFSVCRVIGLSPLLVMCVCRGGSQHYDEI